MQEASIPGFVKTLLWILAFYYIFKFLARLFFPILVKKAVQKAEEQFKRVLIDKLKEERKTAPVKNN